MPNVVTALTSLSNAHCAPLVDSMDHKVICKVGAKLLLISQFDTSILETSQVTPITSSMMELRNNGDGTALLNTINELDNSLGILTRPKVC